MADHDAPSEDAAKPKPSRRIFLLAPLVFAAAAAAGFLTHGAGLSPLPGGDSGHDPASPMPDIAYVPLDPLVVNLGSGRFLRFQAQVEVRPTYLAEVQRMIPRIVDVLNGYLRAVDLALLEDRNALFRLKAQMLRRIQMVTGSGRVRDLLVMEFVVS